MTTTVWIDLDGCADVPAARIGGKARGLGQLLRYGFDVPGGGVLTVDAHALPLPEKTALVRRELERLGVWGRPLAVRSSATTEDSREHSFAGIHESVLNVRGEDGLRDALATCYASLESERARSYRQGRGLRDEDVRLAVVVMELVAADAAGVAFSADPRTGRRDVCVINANHGLGESVVSGTVDPDEFHVQVRTYDQRLIARRRGRKESRVVPRAGGGTETAASPASGYSLTDAQVHHIARTCQRVQDALGALDQPYDVEWVLKGERVVVVQARPVTHLPRYTYPVLQSLPTLWSSANVKDAIPFVVPPALARFMPQMGHALITAAFPEIGFAHRPGLEHMRVIDGRVYINIRALQWEIFDAFGMSPRLTTDTTGGHHDDIEVPPRSPLGDQVRRGRAGLRMLRVLFRVAHEAEGHFADIQRFVAQRLALDMNTLTPEEAARLLVENEIKAFDYAVHEGPMNNAAGAAAPIVQGLLRRAFGDRARPLLNQLMHGLGKIPSAEQGYRLLALAGLARESQPVRDFLGAGPAAWTAWRDVLPKGAFRTEFERYLDAFGHRAVYEGDVFVPRWSEDPTYLFESIAGLLASPPLEDWRARQAERREQAWAEVRAKTDPVTRWILRKLVHAAVRGAELREAGKSELVRFMLVSRHMYLGLGRRWTAAGVVADPEDLFFLSGAEVMAYLLGESDGRAFRTLAAERRARFEAQKQMAYRDLIEADDAERRVLPLPERARTDGRTLAGIAVSQGRAEGKARVILHPREGAALQMGEVLIAPSTDPGWTPLFLKAAGLVMETGGYLSHGAIVAREFGIPAVVNVTGVLSRIRSGDAVTVDGDLGNIRYPADE
jgi:phosphohistidine swiveling domain-containing protein